MPDPASTARKLRAMLDLDVLDTSAVNDAIAIIEPRADESRKALDPQLIIDTAIKVACPGLDDEFYTSSHRSPEVVVARIIAVGLIREMCPLYSYPDIAHLMGSGRIAHATPLTQKRWFDFRTKTKPDERFISMTKAVRLAVIEAHASQTPLSSGGRSASSAASAYSQTETEGGVAT